MRGRIYMTQLADRVMVLGNGNFNYFIVGREEAVLIECGTSAGADIFARQWQAEKNRPRIKYILVMHSHFDHVCGLPRLKDLFPQAQTAASPAARKILARDKLKPVLIQADAYVTDAYVRNGLLPDAPGGLDIDRVQAELAVAEGDSLIVDEGLQLDIIEAPGHSPCSLAAYFPSAKAMFISDAAGYQIPDGLRSPVFFQDYDLYRETIRRLQQYPTEIVGVGHGEIPVGHDQVSQFYNRSMEAAAEAFDLIKDRLDRGQSEQSIVTELYDRYIKGAMSYYPPDLMMGSVSMLVKNVKNRM